MNNQSDTPETDEAEFTFAVAQVNLCQPLQKLVMADHARKLERERDEARAIAERYSPESRLTWKQKQKCQRTDMDSVIDPATGYPWF